MAEKKKTSTGSKSAATQKAAAKKTSKPRMTKEEKEAEKADEGVFEFRPLGEGMQNWDEILKAAEETSAKWLIFEQDDHNGIGALEAARRSMEFLKG